MRLVSPRNIKIIIDTIRILGGCYIEGFMFSGPSFDHVGNVGDPMNCQHVCELVPACEFWSYRHEQKDCWLMRQDGGFVLGLNSNAASGVKSCSGKNFIRIDFA